MALFAIASAYLLTKDKRLQLAGVLMLTNCLVSNVIIANYHELNDLEQYLMVPGICYVAVYLLNIDHRAMWLSVLYYLFLLEMLVSLARALELFSHLLYFVIVDVNYTLECLTIVIASIYCAVTVRTKKRSTLTNV